MDFNELEKTLEITISKENKDLFVRAFTHRSYLNEIKESKIRSNERLEFLGDAVLQFLSSEYLFKKYNEREEGDLTAFRASIVNTNSLAQESSRLNYGKFLLLSKGEEQTGGRERPYILANTFESVIGAIYLSTDIGTVRNFLNKNLFYKIDTIVQKGEYRDKKSLFQEKAQELKGVTPVYKVVKEWGPDHDKKFEVGVYLDKDCIATGKGRSKQKAESDAAKKALNIIEVK